MAAFTDGRIVTASEIVEHRTDLVSNRRLARCSATIFCFIANAGIYNLEDDRNHRSGKARAGAYRGCRFEIEFAFKPSKSSRPGFFSSSEERNSWPPCHLQNNAD
jgi:hypothetical protein